MNIDQRLEKLTERHEALSQSVELLTMQVREFQVESRENFKQITKSLGVVSDALASLVRVADHHERRIQALEG